MDGLRGTVREVNLFFCHLKQRQIVFVFCAPVKRDALAHTGLMDDVSRRMACVHKDGLAAPQIKLHEDCAYAYTIDRVARQLVIEKGNDLRERPRRIAPYRMQQQR